MKEKKALVIVGLLYSRYASQPALDVANLLSSLVASVEVIYYPSLSFESMIHSIQRWLRREFSLLNKILREKDMVDLLILHQMVGVFGSSASKIRRAKVLVYVGGSFDENLHQKSFTKKIAAFLEVLLWKLQLRLADLILIPEKELKKSAKLCGYSHKLKVAPTRMITFTSFGEREKRNIVGYVGRFETEKGVDKLPEIIRLTVDAKEILDLQWILIGEGTLRPFVENTVRELGLVNNVIFTGWVQNSETYLRKLKLLVLPSKTEGLPNVILEAMACGTPVLATPVGGIPNIIKDGENGFLLKSNDPRHIANQIVELLNQPALLEKVSKNAYEWVRENFSEEKTLESWRRILQELENSQ